MQGKNVNEMNLNFGPFLTKFTSQGWEGVVGPRIYYYGHQFEAFCCPRFAERTGFHQRSFCLTDRRDRDSEDTWRS